MSMFQISPTEFIDLYETSQDRLKQAHAQVLKWGGVSSLCQKLVTDEKKGRLDTDAVKVERLKVYGDNTPVVKPPKTVFQMILDNFEDTMLRILCLAALVSLALGIATEGLQEGWMEGTSILVAVVIIVSVTAGNQYVKQKQFEKLNALSKKKNVDVIRGGEVVNISSSELLVGDIQKIETGEILSVDGILIESFDILTDESQMTGQSEMIKKTTFNQAAVSDCFVISGSKVISGTGAMLVLATGSNSQEGIITMRIQEESTQTPLQEKLDVLGGKIGQVGLIAATLTFICMLGHIAVRAKHSGDFIGYFSSMQILHEIVQAFIVAVTIIVVAVPEGLPLAVTIALAYSVNKMKDENNLVRYLAACETMGGADNICSDKTGTLTKNIMAVTRLFIQERTIEKIEKNSVDPKTAQLLSHLICLNSNANPKITLNADGTISNVQIGNKTECALLELAMRFGFDFKKFRDSEKIVKTFPFASDVKMMTTIAKFKGNNTVFTKGAPDFLLERCASYINSDGQVVPIIDSFKRLLNDKLEEFAKQMLRTLVLAYREGGNAGDDFKDATNNLIIVGMVGIKDPLKEEIPYAVKQCAQASVCVRMITGDHENTAIAIAKEAGILNSAWVKTDASDCTVMTGQNFRKFVGGLVKNEKGEETVQNQANFKKVAKELRVLARSSPSDKYLMAAGLKELGHVVAMTGDGTNDAPALKKADIGFAMGIAGTEVAKEASGIILLDDNFKSIVTAIKWGRNIFDSIRKFLQFQLTVNIAALAIAFIGAAILEESPLNPIQMLWVNLIMDTLASLALATEPPGADLLKRKPYSRNENIMTIEMWRNVLSQGFLQIVILSGILFKGDQILGIKSSIGHQAGTVWDNESGKHYCIFFNVFVLLQVFNEINSRKLKANEYNVFQNFFNNPLFLIILVATLVIQILCVQFGGEALKTVPLSLNEHLLCIALGALSIPYGFIVKLVVPTHIFKFLV